MGSASCARLKGGWRLGLCLLAVLATEADAAPRVVASVVPIHSLVAGVMENVAEPALIVRGFQSPHTYQMRPSDAANIHQADVMFWVGRSFETFLDRSISALPPETRVVELADIEGLLLLPNRGGGVWESRDHRHTVEPSQALKGDHEHAAEHRAGRFDPHIWLDIDNAKRIVRAIASELSDIDPENANAYERNMAKLLERLDQLDQRLQESLNPLRSRPYLTLHDAYQYLEHRYGLNAVGALMLGPERMPSAKRIRTLRTKIQDLGAVCIFREPQFESALLQSLIANTDARIGIIDPIGSDLSHGPDAYFEMMGNNVDALVLCLPP
jgi:zinc transport system substrate-binding protein